MMHKRFLMSSIGELTFFLGLQVMQKDDGIFISQDKYVADILKKFDFVTVKAASTLIETNKALNKDEEAKDVDASHLHAMKKIVRYLKGQPKLGLWYPRDSPFDLEAFSDSDYAGASLDRKSTIGGCQFLGKRLISWQCKKQTIVANSTTKAEYVAAANCYGQLVADEIVYKEWEDRMERAATTASSLEAEQDGGNINRTQSIETLNESFPQGTDSVNILGSGEDSMKLMELMEHYTKLSELFWQTTSASTPEDGKIEITATIDGRFKTVTEASIRRHLKLEDSD
ncbi:uncharacterized mitochondrial protein-like protein, partial [Tanacetum coccineum]